MNGGHDASSPQDFVASALARRADIALLTLYRIDPRTRTLLAVTPAALETFPDVRSDEIRDAETIAAALSAIQSSKPAQVDTPLDARFGLVFASRDGERILSAYKGQFASTGQIDDTPVSYLEQALHDWLTAFYAAQRVG